MLSVICLLHAGPDKGTRQLGHDLGPAVLGHRTKQSNKMVIAVLLLTASFSRVKQTSKR